MKSPRINRPCPVGYALLLVLVSLAQLLPAAAATNWRASIPATTRKNKYIVAIKARARRRRQPRGG